MMLMENVPSGSLSQSCFAQVLQLLPVCTCVSGCSWSLSPCWCFMDSSLISTWDKAGAGEARTSGVGLSSPKPRPILCPS